MTCILEPVTRNPKRKKAVTEAGIVGTFKRSCEWSSYGYPHRYGGTSRGLDSTTTIISPSTVGVGESFWKWRGGGGSMRHMHGSGHSTVGIDEDRSIQRARVALDWLEHGEGYVCCCFFNFVGMNSYRYTLLDNFFLTSSIVTA